LIVLPFVIFLDERQQIKNSGDFHKWFVKNSVTKLRKKMKFAKKIVSLYP